VLCGSAYRNRGVRRLLNAVVDYLPSPLDVPPVEGENPDTLEREIRHASIEEPFAAVAFKIMTDPYVGKLTFFRVYSGRVKTGDSVLNTRTDSRERIGRMFEMHANQREEISEIHVGEIGALVGVKKVSTGDTSARRSIRSCSSGSSFPSRSSRCRSSPTARPTRTGWPSR